MTFRLASLVLAPLALAACGGDGTSASSPDAPPVTADAAPAVDAAPCDLTGYPEAVRRVELDFAGEQPLALDGTGTRCAQIVRALTGDDRPVQLADLDAADFDITCEHDRDDNGEIVRLRGPRYGGLPMFAPIQDLNVKVAADGDIVSMGGAFVPSGHVPPAACLDGHAVGASMIGRGLGYQRYHQCLPQGGPASYTIAAGDTVDVADEGVFLDDGGLLHRVRAVDIYLAEAHVDDAVGSSDAFCCNGTLDHCVGKRLFVDVRTGELLGQEAHCHIC